MNVFQRACRSCIRKPVKSILLLMAAGIISLLFLSGMASRSANIAAKDSTRQAIGAGFLLENNPENRSKRLSEASEKIAELYPDGVGSYGGVHLDKITVNGAENWRTRTDNSFESLRMDDIEKIAKNTEGLSGYNVTTVPTAVKPGNFTRIEDPDTDQSNDFQGVTLIGNLDMSMDSNVLSGNVTIKEGRMTNREDTNVCVISEELAEENKLHPGDTISFHSVEAEEPVQEVTIVGIYQVKEKMQPYMSGDTFRSENVIFTDLHVPEKVEQDDPLYEKAYFKVADVDDYEKVKERIKKTDIDWQRYDLIDNQGNLDTMAENFNDLESISNVLLLIVAGAGFVILSLIFIFWIRNRTREIGILMSLGISKGRILLQILTEAVLIGWMAAALSLIAAPQVTRMAAGYLTDQQVQQAEISKEQNAGKVATDYQAPELTVTSVEANLTPEMILADFFGITGLILLSVSAAGSLILVRKPRDLLSEMS